MSRIKDIKKKLDSLISERDLIKRQLNYLKKEEKVLSMYLIKKKKALELVKDSALKTQQQLQVHLSEMVTTGLNSVFDETYDFQVIFEIKRDKTECGLFFQKKGHLINPVKRDGIGACDVAAFCLRCAAWSMDNKRNVLILDEPFRHLKGKEENIRVIQLMNKLSRQLNLQIICVNDERVPREDIVANSDKTFVVTQNNKGVSKIKVIE